MGAHNDFLRGEMVLRMSYNFDPELKEAIPFLPTSSEPMDVEESRELMASVIELMNAGVDVNDLVVEDHQIPAENPTREILVRTYRRAEISGLRARRRTTCTIPGTSALVSVSRSLDLNRGGP